MSSKGKKDNKLYEMFIDLLKEKIRAGEAPT